MTRISRTRRAAGVAALALSCATVVAVAGPAHAGDYTLTSHYLGDQSAVRGWTVEWKVPQVTNQSTAYGVVGQWYDNLESGIYLWAGQWHVYFYGDDNGIGGYDPNYCIPNWQNDDGQYIGGWCGAVQPGARLVFKYEWCTTNNQPSVNGTQRCVWVDLKDGQGYRFLAQDGGRPEGPEMYAHEVEVFEPQGSALNPVIPCSAPIRMVRQTRKTATGSWVTMTGSSTWRLDDNPGNTYRFQNVRLGSRPASWEACSG